MTGYLELLITWLHAHPVWAGLITFFISGIESVAIIGTIVPGSVTLAAIGILVGNGTLPAIDIIVWAILGAIVGDGLSYWIGYRYQEQLREMWPFLKYPKVITAGKAFFAKHGVKSVFLGRFTGPLRSIVPVIAGMLQMEPKRFYISNIASAIAWAPTHMLPGILVGAASIELPPEASAKLFLYFLLAISVIWFSLWLSRKSLNWVIDTFDVLLDRIWQFFQAHPGLRKITVLLQGPASPGGHGQLSAAILLFILCSILVFLSINVTHQGISTYLNAPFLTFITSFRTPIVDNVMVFITVSAEKTVILVMFLAVGFFLLLKQYWRAMFHWFANGVILIAVAMLLRHWVVSPRPDIIEYIRSDASFPSGHITLITGILGLLTVFLASQTVAEKRRRYYYGYASLVCLMAVSRLYLGAHTLPDIWGGVCLGMASVTLVTLSFRRQIAPLPQPRTIVIVALLSWFIAWGGYASKNFSKQVANYALKSETHTIEFDTWWQQSSPVLPIALKNRIGENSVDFNIQAAIDLGHLEKHLLERGWKIAPKPSIVSTLASLVASNKIQQLPLLPPLYRNQNPNVVFVKHINKSAPLLIANFWMSGYQFSDKPAPLWIGTVNYRILWNQLLFHKNETTADLQDPLTVFTTDLIPYRLRTVEYKSVVAPYLPFSLALIRDQDQSQ